MNFYSKNNYKKFNIATTIKATERVSRNLKMTKFLKKVRLEKVILNVIHLSVVMPNVVAPV